MTLWESDHPYHATSGCFYSRDCHENFGSWSDFMESWGDSDYDYNLLYRWDWHEGEEHEIPAGIAELKLFFMLQRKAAPRSVSVRVSRSDESSVREWLQARWEHMIKVWDPLSSARAKKAKE